MTACQPDTAAQPDGCAPVSSNSVGYRRIVMKAFALTSISLLLIPGFVFGAGRENSSETQKADSNSQYMVRVNKPECVPGECICSGRVSPAARLNETGPGVEDLERGVPCIAADFDGNGFTDFAIPGAEGTANVIMSNAAGFWRASRIDAGGVLELYPPRFTKGKQGEPISKNHGLLVRWVGQSHAVFTWGDEEFSRTLFPVSHPE